ncbi:helix-turn-helix domain-containing protein [Streptomyces sp. UNOB3_S3]|uniref:helix-turn-helix domain-containing protein n=1 Tax=Streptomyces sp. UNOB3_S3 TaxID=2871682 RepID=UPI001E2E59B1|nr:helix-turn-helix domain-containing protein [Streptomyces sp. UNOB3_S3]MCC3774515.1 helix-turn-helix domain-containing protein [Streptomyces sp. UNOB3_S3]
MQNERLRVAMNAGGWTCASLAEKTEVDPKSVERWVNLGRTPRRATAFAAAELLREDVYALWPALRQARAVRALSPDLVALYDRRADLPVSLFVDLFAQAREHIDVLVYAAVFLHEAYPALNDLLRQRAAEGCAVRIAIGDPEDPCVRQRGEEEKFGHGIESRCRLALMHYRPLVGTAGIELRTHRTTLYNSLYRADDEVLVNAHAWGANAYAAPVWHLRRTGDGGMFDTYAESFGAVWATATPVQEG